MTNPDNDRIADPLDRAAAETEHTIAVALSVRKPTGPVANGECHNCGEDVADNLRWCDAECRNAWEQEQEADRRRNGVNG